MRNLLAERPPYSEEDVSWIRAQDWAHELLPFHWIQMHLLAGDPEAALDVLEHAVAVGDPDVFILLRSTYLRPLHSDPRYEAILVSVGLDDESVRRLGLGC